MGVSRARVRTLVASGRLPAIRLGRDFFVDPDDVERLLRGPRLSGRPLSPRSCWRLLLLAGGSDPSEGSRTERQRDRERLAALSDLVPGALALRATLHQLVANPGILRHLSQDPRLTLGGVSAAGTYGADVIGASMVEAYVRESDLPGVAGDFALDAKPAGEPANVILRVPRPEWPFRDGAEHAPPAVAAADLVDHGDERSVRAGRLLLAKILSEARP